MSRTVPREAWLRYVALREQSYDRAAAAKRCGISYATACAFDRGDPASSGHDVWGELCRGRALWESEMRAAATTLAGTGVREADAALRASHRQAELDLRLAGKLYPQAARDALADPTGRLFRQRYFGRVTMPWQDEVWEAISDRYDTGIRTRERQFMLVNCPPGAGKTTILADKACDLIARRRSIRIGMFSIASAVAAGNTRRVKVALERTHPLRAKDTDRDAGAAVDAQATLAGDFGAFKPLTRDLWTREMFIVQQDDGEVADDKEPTCAAWGFDASFIGQRLDVVFADDMVDKRVTRNPLVMENQREVWDNEAESRLEPGGLLVLIGQKLGADDLYAYAEKQTMPILDDDGVTELDVTKAPKRYFHMMYPAHDDTRCVGIHRRGEAQPQPNGCLLDPVRLPYNYLMGVKQRDPRRFAVVYQQADHVPGSNLVEPEWIDGGIGPDGEVYVGCWDTDRSVWQRPNVELLDGAGIITVDPSSTKFWAVQAWWYQAPIDPAARATLAGRRYLLALQNARLDAPSLLGMNVDTREFYGVLEEFRQAYAANGMRLSYVVIEAVHAQRFLLQLKETHRWSEVYGISLMAHQTNTNKWDPDIGVTTIAPHWRHGRIRLPGKTPADREHVRELTNQVTTWGRRTQQDQTMASWFLEAKLPALPLPNQDPALTRARRPSWLTHKNTRGAVHAANRMARSR